jgi:GNAT superfamily N-acetyltransferase
MTVDNLRIVITGDNEMISDKTFEKRIEIHPASAERWADMEQLFGSRGGYAGCWCMYWRVRHADFGKINGEKAKAAMQELTKKPIAPGVLAYLDGQVVGWCSVAPRADYVALAHSKDLAPVDDLPVWSIVCFFIDKKFRRKGVSAELLRGAVRYAAENGAQVVEAYPIDMDCERMNGKNLTRYSGFMGIVSVFKRAGFELVKAANEVQWIMRYQIKQG